MVEKVRVACVTEMHGHAPQYYFNKRFQLIKQTCYELCFCLFIASQRVKEETCIEVSLNSMINFQKYEY